MCTWDIDTVTYTGFTREAISCHEYIYIICKHDDDNQLYEIFLKKFKDVTKGSKHYSPLIFDS